MKTLIGKWLWVLAGVVGIVFSGCNSGVEGWKGKLVVTERGKSTPAVFGELWAKSSGGLLFNVNYKGHEMSVIDDPSRSVSVSLIHAFRAYVKLSSSEIESSTLYRCHPGNVLTCLSDRHYRKVAEETVDGHPCDVYEGATGRENVPGTERIWHPKDLEGVYWLKAIVGLNNGKVFDARLSDVKFQKLEPELFEIPSAYKQMGVPGLPTGH